ncbi:MAG: WecB/TagA/CpsF family glycosyltransferase [Caldiserica bacterium]|nr:WecB/TagA/CpsF family glycosyltransferase [Caldisericota bacterium]
MSDRVQVAGIPVDNLDMDEALAVVDDFVTSRTPHMGVAINPEKVIRAKQDKALERVLRHGDLNFCDGIGIIWASRVFYHERIKSRITGVDLFLRLLELADARGWRLFLLGSRPEVLSRVVAIVKERYPGLAIAGSHDGYFTPAEEPGLVAEITASRADIMFVGMGSPKQEKFLAGNLSAMRVSFAMGVGGSYNVLSGEFKRAPARVQRLGLEWLYRFVLDPKRLPRILSLPRFVGIVLRFPREHVDDIDFFGISISNRDVDELLEMADGFVKSATPHLIVTLNGEMAARAFRDAEFLEIVQQADMVVADGVGIVWGARMLGPRIENRIPGIEFSGSLLALAERKGYRAYFLGAKPEIIERAAANVITRYPALHLVGFHSGYFDAAEEVHMIQEIREAHIDILLVGMGGGAQEKWIWRHRDIGIPIAIGVGGTFDVWSGLVRRAPRFVQKTGTEWLYRLVVQPSRVRRVGSIFYFMFRVLAHRRTTSRT